MTLHAEVDQFREVQDGGVCFPSEEKKKSWGIAVTVSPYPL